MRIINLQIFLLENEALNRKIVFTFFLYSHTSNHAVPAFTYYLAGPCIVNDFLLLSGRENLNDLHIKMYQETLCNQFTGNLSSINLSLALINYIIIYLNK